MADPVATETNTSETPSIAQVIIDAIEARLTEVHTSLPGKVQSYDKSTGMATIQPLIKRKFKDGDVVDLPICNQVPVAFPRTTTAWIHLPVKKGDVGLLLFSERSIDRYKNLGGSQDPKDPRKHSLSDAFFIPGGYPKTTPATSVEADAIHIKNVSSQLIMREDGSFEVKNDLGTFSIDKSGKYSIGNDMAELLDLLERSYTRMSTILDNILALTVPTGVGPSGVPINAASFTADKVDVELLKTELGLMKQ